MKIEIEKPNEKGDKMDENNLGMEQAMVNEIIEIIPDLSDYSLALIGIAIQNEIDRRFEFSKLKNENESSKNSETLRRVK